MHSNTHVKVAPLTLLPQYFPSSIKLFLRLSKNFWTYFFIEVTLWKIENKKEAMGKTPLCFFKSSFLFRLFFSQDTCVSMSVYLHLSTLKIARKQAYSISPFFVGIYSPLYFGIQGARANTPFPLRCSQ